MLTLKIVYDRDKEISEFQSSTYHKLLAHFKTAQGEVFESTYYERNEEDKYNEKFEDKAVLEKMN